MNADRTLEGKPEGKTTRKTELRKVDSNAIDVKGRRQRAVDWIDLAQDRDQWMPLVNAITLGITNLCKFLFGLEIDSLSRTQIDGAR
jgi:hypothetical protein